MNKKGFTLMELLAVIVILSVLILLAMPAVLRLMENAKKNAFITESQEILKIANTAYADKIAKGETVTEITLEELKTEGYTDKNFSSDSGKVEFERDANGVITSKLTYSNGTYSVSEATMDEIKSKTTKSNVSDLPTMTIVENKIIDYTLTGDPWTIKCNKSESGFNPIDERGPFIYTSFDSGITSITSKNAINLSSVNKLIMNFTNYSNSNNLKTTAYIGVSDEQTPSYVNLTFIKSKSVDFVGRTGNYSLTLDTSDITGSHYIKIVVQHDSYTSTMTSQFAITSLYLEK